jgi:hypothetical protein
LSDAADALIVALVSILGLVTCGHPPGQAFGHLEVLEQFRPPRKGALIHATHSGISVSSSPLRLPQPPRGPSTEVPIRPWHARRDNDEGDGQRPSARAQLAPVERVERRMTLLDLALAGEAA